MAKHSLVVDTSLTKFEVFQQCVQHVPTTNAWIIELINAASISHWKMMENIIYWYNKVTELMR